MSTEKVSTDSSPRGDDDRQPLVGSEAKSYRRVLSDAGGRELDLLGSEDAGAMICTAIYVSPPYDLRVRPLSVARLSVNLTGSQVSGGIEGGPSRTYEAHRHSVFLVPDGAPVTWCKKSPSRHVTIYFHPELFDGGDEDRSTNRKMEAVFNLNVQGVGALADQLAAELEGRAMHRIEAADSLARLLLIRVSRHVRRSAKGPSGLTPAMLAHLKEYVLAHLSERILVTDLAQQVNLSPNLFARCFAEQTGKSPHTFVLDLRLDRAVQLLGRSKLSLVEITHECGFSSQQHLNNVLKRYLGATPGRFRARLALDRETS